MESSRLAVCFLMLFVLPVIKSHECKLGYYGHTCENKCGECVGGPIFCDPGSGHCYNGCAWGYRGKTCTEKCSPGTYGVSCSSTCSPNCLDPICDFRRGNCTQRGCKAGYLGKDCTKACPVGYYGDKCASRCACVEDCGCDHVNGTCFSLDQCHTHDPKAKAGQSRWQRAESIEKREAQQETIGQQTNTVKTPQGPADDDGTAGETKERESAGTQMMCSKLEKEFSDLKEKLNNKVDIPLWPLVVLLAIISIILIAIGLWDMLQQYKREVYMAQWEKENLDKPLEEAALLAQSVD
ncbi:scavenger receptor class F member 2 [Biomphalaria glabrata]|nr:multiple epidermal growth factor-like domains protein 10 isoform X1 [Biomphalaria glabrata]